MAIHYFNPGHETAVLNASKHYHPPAHVAKMQTDLAFLPAGYASGGDYVFMETSLPNDFIRSFEPLKLDIKQVTPADFATNREVFRHSAIDLWGISPQSVHFFEKLNEEHNLSLTVPQWKEELRFLGSRFAAQQLLAGLLNRIPEIEPAILPCFYSGIEAIEKQMVHSREQILIKSPYSSSGRGLLWLPPGKLSQSERQILTGMLKKQSQVSVEKVLDKQLDFSMQFENTVEGETRFIGYSIFRTNAKGAYEKSLLASRERAEKRIAALTGMDLLLQTRIALTEMIREMFVPFYSGIIGIDLLVYKSGGSFRLHPCVEINMRKNMGYLSVRLTEKHLHTDSHGEFMIGYNSNPQTTVQKHKQLQMQHPLTVDNGFIRSGYLNLCPVTETTNFHAYLLVSD
jgi:hypothetical protein